ncbi:transcription initiation factor IIB 2 [Halorubrum sp. Atlit-8R]|jgi:transcription initiation factor TFIIB|uniref:Transcription initiation factor IIB n=1 Tax=Halorubrum salinarum TaxID=2739057 RepID=A0A7D4BFK4_9EURY|nr:transcription initiation factor IIB 2 [Halorubrum salinarum]RLM76718.1 transcription initiation factor IIB 2 [Halorubrum sp. Atlit-8R]TKX85151.1 transcription initiation factor IIB 2 [Halorubrum sp. SS5]
MRQEHNIEQPLDNLNQASEYIENSVCPECSGQITHNDTGGESTCEDCGLIFKENRIDHGPEWRAFTSEERDEKSRVGSPTTRLMHDKGLSTTIGWRDEDANGKSVPDGQRALLQRLRMWDERFRAKNSHERNLKQAFGEINRMASALGLPKSIRETAGILYRRAVEKDLLPGRSIEGMSTASLYAATRQHGMPRPLEEFSDVSRVKKIRVQRAYRYLSRELELKIEPELPTQFLPQFASSLGVSDEAEQRSREILEVATENGVHSGKNPAGLAAAALYAATHLTNEQLTQETVSEVAHISQVTIQNRYKELLEVYEKDI